MGTHLDRDLKQVQNHMIEGREVCERRTSEEESSGGRASRSLMNEHLVQDLDRDLKQVQARRIERMKKGKKGKPSGVVVQNEGDESGATHHILRHRRPCVVFLQGHLGRLHAAKELQF